MPRPVYTNVPIPYRGNTAELRHRLDRVYDWLLQSPKAKPTVQKTITEFARAAQINIAVLPSTAGVVQNGQTLPVTGGTVTFAVANNVVTATYAATP